MQASQVLLQQTEKKTFFDGPDSVYGSIRGPKTPHTPKLLTQRALKSCNDVLE